MLLSASFFSTKTAAKVHPFFDMAKCLPVRNPAFFVFLTFTKIDTIELQQVAVFVKVKFNIVFSGTYVS